MLANLQQLTLSNVVNLGKIMANGVLIAKSAEVSPHRNFLSYGVYIYIYVIMQSKRFCNVIPSVPIDYDEYRV